MQFSDTVTYQGIVQDIDYLLWGKTAGFTSPFLIADKTRGVNLWFNYTVGLILQSDGNWKWDDDNHTDLPIRDQDLVDGQQDNDIEDTTYLKLSGVAIKDTNGKWVALEPLDRNQENSQNAHYLEDGTNGMPRFYQKVGASIRLFPKPSAALVTLSDGMRLYYQRLPSYFVAGDTAKKPGFAALYHRILSIGPAIDYATANDMTKKLVVLNAMMKDLVYGEIVDGRRVGGLIAHYASRAGDDNPRMRTRKEDYGEASMDRYRGYSDKRPY